MSKHVACMLSIAVWIVVGAAAVAQDASVDRVTVPFSDPSRPGSVKVNLLAGGIAVKTHPGREVIIEAKSRSGEARSEERRAEPAGMKRIQNNSIGLSVEEESNVISIGAEPSSRPIDITLAVPTRTSLTLKTVNDGDIKVEQVQGDMEVSDINGAVTLSQVSGSVVAHALNGNLKVSLVSVDPNKPMSFTSLNGDIDVSLPPDIKAAVSLKSDQGEIYSDFDIRMEPAATKPVAEGTPGKGGKYRLNFDRTMRGTINGGGPEIQFKTFNGNIYIRKSAK